MLCLNLITKCSQHYFKGGVNAINKTAYMVTISDSFINEDFLKLNGKESLAITSLLSRRTTLRSKIDINEIKWHQVCFSMKYLYNHLNIQLNRKIQKDNVIKSLDQLIYSGVFANDNGVDLKDIDVNCDFELSYRLVDKGFTMIYDYEFDEIFSYSAQRIDRYDLFNTYMVIKKYSDNDTKESYPSFDYMMSICNIGSYSTIAKYINILIELGLICCIRGKAYTDVYGEVKKSNNIYKILFNT